jgi:Glycosyltransferase family 87
VLKAATLVGLVPSVMVALAVFWPGPDLISSRGYYVGQDFVNFWMGGKLALEGRVNEIYDREAYDSIVKASFPPASGFLSFSYPPHSLPLLLALGLLPYGLALILWQTLGLLLFLLVLLAGSDRKEAIELLPFLILSPIVILVLTVGQASFFLAALLVGGLRLMPQRPITAGILLGVLTVKPQLGVLLPFALIMLRKWRPFAAAVCTALALGAVATALFGLGPWQDYFAHTLPFQQRVVTQMVGLYPTMMITPYAEFWWLGLPASTALLLHAGVAVGIIAAASIVLQMPADPELKIAILALASVMVTPYCLNYDMALPTAAIVPWASKPGGPLTKMTLGALGLFWLLPYFGMALTLWHMPVLPIVILALFLALVGEAWRRTEPTAALAAVPR